MGRGRGKTGGKGRKKECELFMRTQWNPIWMSYNPQKDPHNLHYNLIMIIPCACYFHGIL